MLGLFGGFVGDEAVVVVGSIVASGVVPVVVSVDVLTVVVWKVEWEGDSFHSIVEGERGDTVALK